MGDFSKFLSFILWRPVGAYFYKLRRRNYTKINALLILLVDSGAVLPSTVHICDISISNSCVRVFVQLVRVEDTAATVRASVHVGMDLYWTVSPDSVHVDSVEPDRGVNVSVISVISDQTACTRVSVVNMVLDVIPSLDAVSVLMDGTALSAV